jgi:pimeloyl-ACP methyl ester carboxylesterase
VSEVWTDEASMVVRTSGAGPRDVVWVHGLGESSLCFDAIAAHPALAGWRHVRPDLPGYGRSRRPAVVRGLAEVAADLTAWLAARGRPAVIVGHSMGGVIAAMIAEGRPGWLRGVVNVEGNVTIGDCTFSGRAAAQEVEAFASGGFAAMRAWVHDGGVADRALRGYHVSMCLADAAVFHRHSAELVAWSRDGTAAARIAGCDVPTLFIAGAPGGVCDASRVALDAAGVAVRACAPAGHWPFVDQVEAFAAAVAAFASRLTSSP